MADVARGKTIKVRLYAGGSKVLRRVNTLWQYGRRVYDWSPRPGLYKVRSVISYQLVTSTDQDVWIPDSDRATYSQAGYDANYDGDYDDYEYNEYPPYNACAPHEHGYWDWRTTTTVGAKKKVTRYNSVRVHADETPGCVSHAEFVAVKDGMTQARVHNIFGTTGVIESRGSMGVGREYETCAGDEWSYVSVNYNPRVWFKWEYISY